MTRPVPTLRPRPTVDRVYFQIKCSCLHGSGTRLTETGTLAMNLDLGCREVEQAFAELLYTGRVNMWTETWGDYQWLVPADLDPASIWPNTSATVRSFDPWNSVIQDLIKKMEENDDKGA